eukprot:5731755-Prymnesium_polylepis.1
MLHAEPSGRCANRRRIAAHAGHTCACGDWDFRKATCSVHGLYSDERPRQGTHDSRERRSNGHLCTVALTSTELARRVQAEARTPSVLS